MPIAQNVRQQIEAIGNEHGLPGYGWNPGPSEKMPNCIEAQAWGKDKVLECMKGN